MSKNIPNKSDVKDSIISESNRAEYYSLLKEYNSKKSSHWVFSVVPGIFQQSLEDTDETKFDTIKEHFGIIPTWDEVINQLHTLNDNTDDDVQYKLFFWQDTVKVSIMSSILKTQNYGIVIGVI